MAGEWIKVEVSAPDKPEVLRIARILKIDRDSVFGKLVRLWTWFNRNSVDGVVDGVVSTDVDALVDHSGFAAACVAVGWLAVDTNRETVEIPNFARHNGESAKKRALKSERQAKWRGAQGKNVDGSVDGAVSTSASTREEKRRSTTTPLTPSSDLAGGVGGGNGQTKPKRERKKAGTRCPAEFEVNDAMASWAISMGLPPERITTETEKFLDHHTAKGSLFSDWSAAWRTWIRNAVQYAGHGARR